jgi:hypothetical protein
VQFPTVALEEYFREAVAADHAEGSAIVHDGQGQHFGVGRIQKHFPDRLKGNVRCDRIKWYDQRGDVLARTVSVVHANLLQKCSSLMEA